MLQYFWFTSPAVLPRFIGILSVSTQRAFAVFEPLMSNTLYLHLCDQRTRHYKRFDANWRRTCSSSNNGVTVLRQHWPTLLWLL